MEPIVFNLFFVPFFFGICVGGEGKGFTFVFYVSQVNKVILGPPPCLQVLGGAWVLHVAGKKQLFLTSCKPMFAEESRGTLHPHSTSDP